MKNSDYRYSVLGFDDYADGIAYITRRKLVKDFSEALNTAFYFLPAHDHICIITNENMNKAVGTTFDYYAPLSLIIEAGQFFDTEEIVNKL